VFLTALLPNSHLLKGSDYPHSTKVPIAGIADERSYYYYGTGLLCSFRQNGYFVFNSHGGKQEGEINALSGKKTVEKGSIGFYGLSCGPEVHVIDHYALGDALLARMPAKYDSSWRIGHLKRMVPEGYKESIEQNENLLVDPQLAEYYDVLHNIISGDLFSAERFNQIIKMNLGQYDDLIDKDFYRGYVAEGEMSAADFSKPIESGDVWDTKNAWLLNANGVDIKLDKVTYTPSISIFADHNDEYWILVKKDGEVLYRENTGSTEGDGLQLRMVTLPDDIVKQGYDTITVIPFEGDGKYSIGYLQLQ